MEEASYKIKRVRWPPWSAEPRLHPILLQDVNGPCPLIAILNVLMLRGTLTLPAAAGEISQARAVQMLAEHLLDTNFSRTEGPAATAELRANLAHNLSDAIVLLPKLTTGIDVNVRFDGSRSLEYTGETAVFDLLGIDLVHGWLVDPQDHATAGAIGARSYNELVLAIVAALGSDATPVASGRPSEAAQQQAPQTQKQTSQTHKVDAETLAAALQSTLRVQIPEGPPTGMGAGDLRSRSTGGSSGSADSVTQAINRMVGDTVKEAFKTPTSSGRIGFSVVTEDPALLSDASAAPTPAAGGADAATDALQPPLIDLTEPAEAAGAAAAEAMAVVETNEPGEPKAPPATPPPSATTTRLDLLTTNSSDSINLGAEATATPPTAPNPAVEAATRDALLSREFLEQNPSQLTVYGLSSLMDDMREQQLAVFFRNNHFNVLLRSGAGLYILVTDQGYMYESDVVWEHLNNVDGDTELLGWDLRPFQAHTGGGGGKGTAAALEAAGELGPEGGVNEDADFALAMQLQVEEEERVRAEDERRRAAAAARQQEQEQQRGRQGSGARPPTSPARQGSGSRPGKPKKKTSDCSVM